MINIFKVDTIQDKMSYLSRKVEAKKKELMEIVEKKNSNRIKKAFNEPSMLRKELKNLQIGQQKFSKLKGESKKIGTIKLSKLHAIGIPEEGRENGEIKNILINSNQEFSKINYRHQNIDTRSSENLKKDKYQCTYTHKHVSVHITLKLLKTKEK